MSAIYQEPLPNEALQGAEETARLCLENNFKFITNLTCIQVYRALLTVITRRITVCICKICVSVNVKKYNRKEVAIWL